MAERIEGRPYGMPVDGLGFRNWTPREIALLLVWRREGRRQRWMAQTLTAVTGRPDVSVEAVRAQFRRLKAMGALA